MIEQQALEAGGIARITTILDACTRGNLTNLLTLTALRLRLRLRLRLERPQLRSCAPLPASAPSPVPKLDPRPSLASLSPELAARVRMLGKRPVMCDSAWKRAHSVKGP